jgi:4-hydroxy-tetrahydrodipicolinate reductase
MVVYSLAKFLDEDFDVEIMDVHHKMKKDAPSGTAIMFGETIAKARERNFQDVANFIRYGILGIRNKGEIGFSSQRCGKVVGVHEIGFMGEYEDIKITHESHSKEVFAKGAILAAKWLVKQNNGLYSMNDLTKDKLTPVVKSIYKDFFMNK